MPWWRPLGPLRISAEPGGGRCALICTTSDDAVPTCDLKYCSPLDGEAQTAKAAEDRVALPFGKDRRRKRAAALSAPIRRAWRPSSGRNGPEIGLPALNSSAGGPTRLTGGLACSGSACSSSVLDQRFGRAELLMV